MTTRFLDTRQRKLVDFEPMTHGEVRMYTCGPTVYNYAHIGNYRAYIFEDLLRRYLKWRGYRVTQVMNLTDIDDKIIKACIEQNVTPGEYTQPYKDAFFADLDALRIERAEVYPEATTHIEEMVALTEALLKNGHAYKADDGSIYFKISSFPEYGQLSHMDLSQLKMGARVTHDEYEKDQVSDFALWKAWDEADGNVFWETSLDKGRPGWHLECSAMSMKYLGEEFDIHTGGVDNIFPHHENEIAQSVCGTGKPFARYWLHNEHLIVEGKKMSKSLGNFFTLRDILDKGYPAVAVRYHLLATHYRQQLNFTFDGLDGDKNAIDRLRSFHQRLGEIDTPGEANADFADAIKETRDTFGSHLDDDLNISGALGEVFDFVRETYKRIDAGALNKADAEAAQSLLEDLDRILDVLKPDATTQVDSDLVERLIAERKQARAQKDWKRADEIRDEFVKMGVVLEDTPAGTRWKVKV